MTDRIAELSLLVTYLFVLLWIGIRSARRVKTSSDYTLAGRQVPWVVVMATTGATMIGGGASVGMVSRVYEVGIAAALVTCAWHLQLTFTGLWVAPKLRGLNLITVGDFFHLKFGPLARELAVVNCMIFLIGAVAAQMAAIGTVTNTVLGVPYETALLIGAAVTVFYSTVGGIRAVVSTDVLQFVILVVGIGTASALLVAQQGGFAAMATAAAPGQFQINSNWSTTRVISLFFAFLLGETFVPPYAVRCFIAKSAEQARAGVAGAGIFLLFFLPIATFVLGTAAQTNPQVRQAIQSEQQRIVTQAQASGQSISTDDAARRAHQVAFPTLVRVTFHPIFAGVMIAAIIAAVMSSADSCLSSLATVAMEDVYRRHLNRAASDRQLLRVAQATTFASGIAGVVCAWSFSDIASILEFVYDFWAPTMVLPFLVAVFWYDRRRVIAVVVSMVVGITATVCWRFGVEVRYDIGPALFGFVAAAASFFISLPLTNRLPRPGLFHPGEPQQTAGDSES